MLQFPRVPSRKAPFKSSRIFISNLLESVSMPEAGLEGVLELCFRPLLFGATLCFSDFLEAEFTPQRKDAPKVKALVTNFPSSPTQYFFHSQDHWPGGLPSLPSLIKKDSVFIMRDLTEGVKGVGQARTWKETHHEPPVSRPWNTLALYWEPLTIQLLNG